MERVEQSVVWISGPISYYIVERDDGLKFYLFGDAHTNYTERSCEELYNMKCDGTDGCKTITQILLDWFNYNRHNEISTDFYLEVSFAEHDQRYVYKDDSVIPLLHSTFQNCLTRSKANCKYLPYVRMHYADIRKRGDYDRDIDENIFVFAPMMEYEFFTYVKDEDRINELLIFKDIVINILDNTTGIFNDLFMNNIDTTVTLRKYFSKRYFDSVIGRVYRKIISNTIHHSVYRIYDDEEIPFTKIAAEHNRLVRFDPNIGIKLKEFVTKSLINISYFKSISDIKILLDKITEDSHLNNDDIASIFKTVHLGMLYYATLSMDVYVISRMFIQASLNNTKQIISYTGGIHTRNYYSFLTEYLDYRSIYSQPMNENRDKCVRNYLDGT